MSASASDNVAVVAAGLTPVHVNRVLQALQREGLMERDRRIIRVRVRHEIFVIHDVLIELAADWSALGSGITLQANALEEIYRADLDLLRAAHEARLRQASDDRLAALHERAGVDDAGICHQAVCCRRTCLETRDLHSPVPSSMEDT